VSLSISTGIYELPGEALIHIFGFLTGGQAAKVRRVCKFWDSILEDNLFWKKKLHLEFPLSKKNVQTEGANLVYQKEFQIHLGLKGRRTLVEISQSLEDDKKIKTSLLFSGEKIFLISYQPVVLSTGIVQDIDHIEEMDLNKNTIKLRKKLLEARCLLTMPDGNLVVGDSSGHIEIFDMGTNKSIAKWQANPSSICSLLLTEKEELFSGSKEGKIAISDLSKGLESVTAPVEIIDSSVGTTYALLLDKNGRLVIGGRIGIQFWDLENRKTIGWFKGSQYGIRSMVSCGDRLVCGQSNGTITFCNLGGRFPSVSKSIEKAHEEVVSCLNYHFGKIIGLRFL